MLIDAQPHYDCKANVSERTTKYILVYMQIAIIE
jgi:hypothetical protein